MIPNLAIEQQLAGDYLAFLAALSVRDFAGDLSPEYASRLIASTDNSVYQVLPQAVVFPRDVNDLKLLMSLLAEPRFAQVRLSPRGGGTGTNGQSLTQGIIVDCARYLNRILELNLEQGWVRVQPGVVLDQLNADLKPHGVFFAPNLSPSNRATLGGMVNTDACGQGSRIYGRTSNHVLALDLWLLGGLAHSSRPVNADQLAELQAQPDRIGEIYRELDGIARQHQQEIERVFPKLSRFMTAYDLAHLYDADRQQFNLNSVICGSEGTLALVGEICLKLTPIPKYKELLVVKYQSFDEALADAGRLVSFDPLSIETVDEKILSLAKGDVIYHRVKDFIADEDGITTRTINLIEFVADEPGSFRAKVDALLADLQASRGLPGKAFGWYQTAVPAEISVLWELRKKGVGLLGNSEGRRRPLPFVEDTAVPPEHLAAYVKEFRALLEQHGLEYGMFGHVDVGCLHVRPALDMTDTDDVQRLQQISDGVKDLVRKYGGVMWGEHGRGFRSVYGPEFFGPTLYTELRRIKRVFDPNNQLNPGKICTPLESTEALVSVTSPLRGDYDRQIPLQVRDAFETTVACNGNAQCFNYELDNAMCPSYKATRNQVQSPKGRAGMMREWLRQLSTQGVDPVEAARAYRAESSLTAPWRGLRKLRQHWQALNGRYDFSHEVKAAMDGCLACKACATACPIKVNVPSFRSRFLELYYSRYLRPVKDHLVGRIESLAALMSYAPRTSNLLLQSRLGRRVQKRLGMVDMPELSSPTLREQLAQLGRRPLDLAYLQAMPEASRAQAVVIVQDAFSSYFDAEILTALVQLLAKLGYQPYVLQAKANGKAAHVKGFLGRFDRMARQQSQVLRQIAALGLPMIGVEPSMVLCYRDEYRELLGDPGFEVKLVQEWLLAELPKLSAQPAQPGVEYQLMSHCTERALQPQTDNQWQRVFRHFGLETRSPALGCCGMSGTYGHETEHQQDSRRIYQQSWAAKIPTDAAARQQVLATGFSCRCQVERFDAFRPQHPVQALLKRLNPV